MTSSAPGPSEPVPVVAEAKKGQLPPAPPTAAAPGVPHRGQKWNTTNLGLRLGADLAGAASAAVLVAPAITIVDR